MRGAQTNKGLKRIVNAFFYSVQGIRACMKTEEAFRQEVILAAVLIPFGLWFGESAAEKIILAGSLILILIVEIVNTAIERAIDRISFERHELSKEAKDMGSAAVLLSIILAVLSWGIILFV